MRLLPVLASVLLFGCSCCHGFKAWPADDLTLESQPLPAENIMAMMDSTVQVHVDIEATLFQEDEVTKETTSKPIKDGWVGSGVVYEKLGEQSMILTANHVLETPRVGDTVDATIDFLGVSMTVGKKRIDSVEISITTADGRSCHLEPLELGHSDTRDTATGLADCDAGRVAKIARTVPVKGEKVFVSGYSLGVPLPLVTEGYASGDMEGGYLLVSAAAAPGNSGGPVFYRGEVIGLLVRGSPRYPHISLVTPLESVLRRVDDTVHLGR